MASTVRLGLFIVRAVVEAHGGALRIASGIGGGTTITVTLPLAMAMGTQADEAVFAAPPPALLPARTAEAG